MQNNYALISVYNKKNLKFLCKTLTSFNIKIIASGNTKKEINKIGYKCAELSKFTGFKEILNGRVKTLHPKVHASLLYKRSSTQDTNEFKRLNFPNIIYLIVNLYPFKKIIKSTYDIDNIIEMIDIGGTTLLRAAAKNYKYLTPIPDVNYYKTLIQELNKYNGKTSLEFRRFMALKTFKLTADYDTNIFKWFNKSNNKKDNKKIKLKYGENNNQKSFFLKTNLSNIIDNQINGKKIGYNNILDISDGLSCINEFKTPTCVIIKHNNPCGVATDQNIEKSFIKAFNSDPTSAFGGIILFNRKIDKKISKKLFDYFFEAIVAPSFDKKSLDILKNNKKLILIKSSNLPKKIVNNKKSVISGTLFQKFNDSIINHKNIKQVTSKKCSSKLINDLIFALKVAKHVKSNAIVLAHNYQTLGIGAGQMNRYDALKLALSKYKKKFSNKKFVCASDAFFPFLDSIKLLKKNNCEAIVQPHGSINDNKIVDYAKKNKLTLFFSKNRYFKH
ncbi:MAG: bifunctional phosphoribosylaminoimidazolecarboxamide formyltransferase/IMP cyclohydrolase PurH [Pelagibacteraceae bacterium]|nr:bifunctional phosphoribosylaminoimidazolecarboxamide formyltransferase/IMP cyclohydrolase PurH [Pelagibacteraceae bacterium]|tara:strand:- start:6367 stop:7872 length:1506 start_codon:yes stop_codon:yes gene_type:complete